MSALDHTHRLAWSAVCAVACAACLWAGRVSSAQAPLPTPSFHHLHLNAADPSRAVAFYATQFPTTAPTTFAGQPALLSGHVLLLFDARAPFAADSQSAYWHFGWHVPSARAAWERYRTTQAPLLPLHTDDGSSVTFSNEWWPGTLTRAGIVAAREKGLRVEANGYGYLGGPDGTRIEFQGDMPAERFNHVHMYQEAVFCAELWYGAHLNAPLSGAARRSAGRRTDPSDCQAELGEPTWLSLVPEGTRRVPAGGVVFGDVEMNWYQRQGSTPLVSSQGQVMDHVGLGVADLNAWLAKLRREGVRVVREPQSLGDTRSFFIEGPSLELIELVELQP